MWSLNCVYVFTLPWGRPCIKVTADKDGLSLFMSLKMLSKLDQNNSIYCFQ